MLYRVTSFLLLSILLAGCTRDFLNQPLVGHKSNTEILPLGAGATRDADEPYIVISFSGGGIRATGFAYAVLSELQKVPDRAGRSLTDEVRIVSSASGGSVTAAWFGLMGAAGLPRLRDNFITRDNMAAMESELLNPVTLAKLAGPSYSRIDVLRERLMRQLYGDATFGDLYRRLGAPITILNATDMATGEVFSFMPNRFDDLCSDLSRFPIAGGVAASAAFPVALTPISLKNFTGPDCLVPADPTWVRVALATNTRYDNPATYATALETERMRGDAAHHQPTVLYQHLLDGGLVDNLGTSAILSEVFGGDPSSQLAQFNFGRIHTLVAIEVVARSWSPASVSTSAGTPGILSVVGAVVDNPIDSATRLNAEVFQTTISDLIRDGRMRGQANVGIPDSIYGIAIDPNQLDETKADQKDLRDRFERIPTSWTMDATALATVETAAHMILYANPCFVKLVQDRSTKSVRELAGPGAYIGDASKCHSDATSH